MLDKRPETDGACSGGPELPKMEENILFFQSVINSCLDFPFDKR